ncbi:response regulator [Algoriphagus sp.]|uniref:response regulator n=1 Tax=Algoriphagus sp. TaxID=1872435 RepID=UPI0025E69E0E|nr:response regulator [Algoriphagus sp.]
MNKRIISIDDDKIQHFLIKKRIQFIQPSAEFFPFENPLLALEWLSENPSDLIFMDLNFPEISGWDLLEKLGEISDSPVVVLTGNIGPEEIEKIKIFPQAIRLFEKPISNDHLSEIFQFLNF